MATKSVTIFEDLNKGKPEPRMARFFLPIPGKNTLVGAMANRRLRVSFIFNITKLNYRALNCQILLRGGLLLRRGSCKCSVSNNNGGSDTNKYQRTFWGNKTIVELRWQLLSCEPILWSSGKRNERRLWSSLSARSLSNSKLAASFGRSSLSLIGSRPGSKT